MIKEAPFLWCSLQQNLITLSNSPCLCLSFSLSLRSRGLDTSYLEMCSVQQCRFLNSSVCSPHGLHTVTALSPAQRDHFNSRFIEFPWSLDMKSSLPVLLVFNLHSVCYPCLSHFLHRNMYVMWDETWWHNSLSRRDRRSLLTAVIGRPLQRRLTDCYFLETFCWDVQLGPGWVGVTWTHFTSPDITSPKNLQVAFLPSAWIL